MTCCQPVPSANAPCTSTIVGLTAVRAAAWAAGCAPAVVAATITASDRRRWRASVMAARRPARRRRGRAAERPERRAQLGHEERRLLPRREVAALRERVVVNELRIRALRPAARRRVDLVGEGAHGDRDLDAPRVEEAA